MKNAGLPVISGDEESNTTVESQCSSSKSSPSIEEPRISKGKEKQVITCSNGSNSSKKDDDNSKQHKIRMPQRKGGLQLWQFLYALLEDVDKQHSELIEWTHNRKELEFRLNDPEAIALWWGIIKHRANMTYERLSRSLRYYYDRGILKKMGGERYLYRFCIDPEEMYHHIGLSDSRPVLKPMPLPVNKWVSSKMIPPQGLEPFYQCPDYMSLSMPHTTQLPPPPPYPGYHFHTAPRYQAPAQMCFDFFTDQGESEANFVYSQPQDNIHGFNAATLTANHSSKSFFSSHSLVSSSQRAPFYTTCQMQPEQDRSLSTTDVLSDTDSDSSQHQSHSFPNVPLCFTNSIRDHDILQYSPETNTHFQYECNSSSGSGSELDEIIPLLESMEDSDSLPLSLCTSPCTFSPYPNATSAMESFSATSSVQQSSSNMTSAYVTAPCNQLSLQSSPTVCNNSYGTPSPWTGEEDSWNFS